MSKLLRYFLFFFSLLIFFGALTYYFYAINKAAIAAILILVFLSSFFYWRLEKKGPEEKENRAEKEKLPFPFVLSVSYFLFCAVSFYLLFSARTGEAIISPWQTVKPVFFFFYAAATFFLLLLSLNSKARSWLLLLFSFIHSFLSFSVALIVYKIGYGFDPFIHQATVELIAKAGQVEPKTLYYLGQYGLIALINKLSGLPVITLDKILLPFLSALLLPPAIYLTAKKFFSEQKIARLSFIFLFLLPWPFFIVTNPQNLAYLFLLLTLLFGLTCASWADLLLIYALALAALALHPLAGLPALIFAAWLTLYHSELKFKKYLYAFLFLLNCLLIPLAFHFGLPTGQAGLPTGEEKSAEPIFSLGPAGGENIFFNFLYFYGDNLEILIALIVFAGLLIAWRYRSACRIFFLYLPPAGALLISYFLVKKNNFSFLIDYEQDDYRKRIILITVLFLAPFLLNSFCGLGDKIIQAERAVKYSWLVFLALTATASLYLTYPRFDPYFNSHGYSTSQNDLEAVKWIENNADENYIVLANQPVSAAALRLFGFKHYYQDNIFYYPIPTGGPLYQYYLKMVYEKAEKKTMEEALNLAGVKIGYFVLNKYWWAFPKVLEEAKLSANSWRIIGQEDAYIFKYEREN